MRPQQVFFHRFRQGPHAAFGGDFEVNVRAIGELLAAGDQRARQIELLQRTRTQIHTDRRTSTWPCATSSRASPRWRLAVSGFEGDSFVGVQLQRDADEGLFQSIVQFLRQSGSFGQHRLELQF